MHAHLHDLGDSLSFVSKHTLSSESPPPFGHTYYVNEPSKPMLHKNNTLYFRRQVESEYFIDVVLDVKSGIMKTTKSQLNPDPR